MPTEIEMWLHVDPQGRVVDVRALSDAAMPIAPVLEAARHLRYNPFMRDGIPVEAWIQDTISLTAATRSPARTIPFPEIKDPAKITIQLGRSGCFGTCPSYLISIRGDGEVTYPFPEPIRRTSILRPSRF